MNNHFGDSAFGYAKGIAKEESRHISHLDWLFSLAFANLFCLAVSG